MPLFPFELNIILATLAAAFVPFFLLWLLSVRLKDASIVDVYWGPGFVVIAVAAFAFGAATGGALVLLAALALWALRLGGHIGLRKLGEPHEDPRYAAMRRKAGDAFARESLTWVFGLQAILQWTVALPVISALSQGAAMSPAPFYAGLAIFAAGLAIEAVGDWQLARFKHARPAPEVVLDTGLWAWSRHPNYFGEAALWWGLFLMSAALGAPWWMAFAPAVMTFLLLQVSGVPMLEYGLKKRKPAYADYARRTSAFIPWPPKRRGA